jgi:hypothetical protein
MPDSSGALLLVGSVLVGKPSCRAGSANIGPPNIFQPTIRRSILQLTIRFDLPSVTTNDHLMCIAPSGDTTTNCLLYSACRYSIRLSTALLCLSILRLTIRSTDCPLCSFLAVLQSSICSTPLGLSILQPNFQCTLLHFVCHNYTRLSALLRDSDASFRSATERLSAQLTTNYLLCFSTPSLIVNSF